MFVGSESVERFRKEVKEGDYFAIADGFDVPSVAKTLSAPECLRDLIEKNMIKVRSGEPFDLDCDYSGCYGVRVKIVDLPDHEHIYYQKRGSFNRAYQIENEVIQAYDKYFSRQFDIKAGTYRIMSTLNQNDGKGSIIGGTIYNIPVYQREYSWGEEQVSRFVSDVISGFWNSAEQRVAKEPIFIGTMQLSYKKYISKSEYEQDVIDGQQRLSTILCFLKYLKLRLPENQQLSKIPLNWLETRVNNGKEDELLNEMVKVDSLDTLKGLSYSQLSLNRYLANLKEIMDRIDEYSKNEEGCDIIPLFDECSNEFIEYILNDIYFVVVETIAGLSKTIQIFNTINTAGLDLSGDDIFKVRLYEYLHDVKSQGEETFERIGNIYKDIKEKNSEWRKTHDYDVITVDAVRSAYKVYLISEHKDLPVSLFTKATDTFFEELFDVLLKVQDHKGIKNIDLGDPLKCLERIVQVVYLWNSIDYKDCNQFIIYTLASRSRYSRYLDEIAYQILLHNEDVLDIGKRQEEVYGILELLSRVFFCWSIQYYKVVHIH